MKWFVVGIVILVGAIIVGVLFINRTDAVTVIKSGAQAWVWVAPDQQQRFVGELRDYAQSKGLQFNTRELAGPPWQMTEVVLNTPKANEIAVANATALDKFSASITVFHPDENWQDYWKDFRAYVGARHRWEDVP
ncbi:MAG: hypothetical protein ACRETG_08200 [Steroidobacteraceae bacterium]